LDDYFYHRLPRPLPTPPLTLEAAFLLAQANAADEHAQTAAGVHPPHGHIATTATALPQHPPPELEPNVEVVEGGEAGEEGEEEAVEEVLVDDFPETTNELKM